MRRRLTWLLIVVPALVPLVAWALTDLTVSPTAASFVTRCVRSAAAPTPVTLRNPDSSDVTDVSVSISPSSLAKVFPLSGTTVTPTLTPGASMTFGVGFVPEHVDQVSGNAIVSYRGAGPTPTPTRSRRSTPTPTPESRTTSISLSGDAIDRLIDVFPPAVNFGAVHVRHRAEPRTITIFDDGDTPLTIKRIFLSGRHAGDFTVQRAPTSTVSDGHPLTLKLAFRPGGGGARAAELVIRSDSCEQSTLKVALAGISLQPDVNVFPKPVDFGPRAIGTSKSELMSVANQGGAALTVSSISLVGKDARRFAMVGAPKLPRVLKPSRSIDFRLRFTPTTVGAFEADLRVRSNDPDKKIVLVPIEGSGVQAPSPTPTASSVISTPPKPPRRGGGFRFPLGKYLPELAVLGSVGVFFFFLAWLRKVRSIPD
jgi:HYDIN/CFA65/VesB family protein